MENQAKTAPLFEICRRFLETHINLENCFDALTLSIAYSLPELKEKATNYVLKNFKDVCQELKFLELKASTLIDILKDDSLNVQNESDVLDAVLRWLHFEQERKQHLGKMLEHVRLAHIEQADLSDRVEEEDALRMSEPVRKLLDKVQNYHSFPSRRLTDQSSITRRRFNSTKVETLEVINSYPNYEKEYISENGRRFKHVPRLNHDDKAFTIRWFPSNYKLGCTFYDSRDLPFRFFIFDFDKGAWTEAARFTRPQVNVQLCEADGIWYAVGGREPGRGFSSTNFDSFDPSTNKWTQLAPLRDAVRFHKVLSLSGAIYVLDYRYGCYGRLIMHEYKIDRNEWTDISVLQDFFYHLANCRALNNRIYVSCRNQVDLEDCVTGFEGGRILEYNVDTREWRECANTNHHFKDGPVVLNGRLCALSKDGIGDHYSVYLERYDPELDSWSDLHISLGQRIKYIDGPYLMNNNWEIVSEDDYEA